MNATQLLSDLGQSLWLDNITRGLLSTGMLRRYIDELPVSRLISNPAISTARSGTAKTTMKRSKASSRRASQGMNCSSS